MSREEIRRELSDILAKLTDEPSRSDAAQLRERQLELRTEARTRPAGPTTVVQKRRQLAMIEHRIDQLVQGRPNIAAMGDGGEGGSGMAELQAWVWEFDESSGLDELRRKAQQLRAEIARSEEVSDC